MSDLVLVTGGAGYIGSVLVHQLLDAGWRVRVVDDLRFGGEALLSVLAGPRFEFVKADVRDEDAMRGAVQGCRAVVHLAAIVGDPACAREPDLARSINVDGTMSVFRLAQESGVERFVFASTCSNYGKMHDGGSLLSETSELRPVSLYAESKVAIERFLLDREHDGPTTPTVLRFATVYGISPRMRFDLTVNEFTRDVVTGHELVVYGEQFWRPYCHVRDLARSVVATLQAPLGKVAYDVMNVGDTNENYQKRGLIELLRKQVPAAKIRFEPKDEDPRDYRVSFEKIRKVLAFSVTRTVPDGIREVKQVLEYGFLLDPYASKYRNVAAG